jgi:hypothetical protein
MEGLIETKNEYIEHMQDIITIPISKKIYEIWCDCSKRKGSIKEFQKELIQIKKWNNNIIDEEYKRIVKSSKCKYLADLIKIIIITTIKIKIYEYKDYFDNIKIKIPAPEDFVHKCYINVSIFSWKNAYLFNNKNIKDSEHQNNLNIIEENFKIIIKKTFRDFIPFNDIFQQIKDNLSENVKQVATDDDNHQNKNVQKDKNKQIPKKVAEEPEESEESEPEPEEESDKSEEESDKSDKSEEESDKSDESEEEPDKSDESEEEPDKSEEESEEEPDKSDESEEESDNVEKTDDEDDVLKESKISIIDSEDSEEDTDDNGDDTEVENRNNIIYENFLRDNNNINLNNKEENGYKNEMYLSKTEDLFYKKEEKTQETNVANVTNVTNVTNITNVIQEDKEEDRYLLPISIKGELQENQAFANKEEKYNISYKKEEEAHIDEPRQQNDKIEQDVKERDVKEIHIDNGTTKSKKLKFF